MFLSCKTIPDRPGPAARGHCDSIPDITKREEIEEEFKIMDPKPIPIIEEAHERILDAAKGMIDEEQLMLIRDASQVL